MLDCEYAVRRFMNTGEEYYAIEFGYFILMCSFENSDEYQLSKRELAEGALFLTESGSTVRNLATKGDRNPWN